MCIRQYFSEALGPLFLAYLVCYCLKQCGIYSVRKYSKIIVILMIIDLIILTSWNSLVQFIEKSMTIIEYIGPFLLLGVGGWYVYRVYRRKRRY